MLELNLKGGFLALYVAVRSSREHVSVQNAVNLKYPAENKYMSVKSQLCFLFAASVVVFEHSS